MAKLAEIEEQRGLGGVDPIVDDSSSVKERLARCEKVLSENWSRVPTEAEWKAARERLSALRQLGPTLEFSSGNAGWHFLFRGCLIGEGGSVYAYDEHLKIEQTGKLSEDEFSSAVETAKSVSGSAAGQRVSFDGGVSVARHGKLPPQAS
jgi:hypothetical protein